MRAHACDPGAAQVTNVPWSWRLLGLASLALLLLAIASEGGDPGDPGYAEIVLFADPLLVAVGAVFTGVLLGGAVVVGRSRRSFGGIVVATVLGTIGGVVAFGVVFATGWLLIDVLPPDLRIPVGGRLATILTVVVPLVSGATTTLLLADRGNGRAAEAQDAQTSATGPIEAASSLANQRRRPSPGSALVGLAAQVIGALLALAWLTQVSPPLAIAWLALVIGVPLVRRRRAASATDPSLAQDLYESLSAQGEQTASELGGVLRSVLIVLGWAVAATAVAIALATIRGNLPHGAQSLVGMAMLLVFLGMLVVGPIWTIRRLH